MKEKKTLNKIFYGSILFAALAVLPACSKTHPGMVRPETKHIVLDKAAIVPPGAVRYCWEEPMVQVYNEGPGLDSDGRWYKPAHVAVREVKQGRWRPCKQMASEIKGETRNER